jgi:hypothetical protein
MADGATESPFTILISLSSTSGPSPVDNIEMGMGIGDFICSIRSAKIEEVPRGVVCVY